MPGIWRNVFFSITLVSVKNPGPEDQVFQGKINLWVLFNLLDTGKSPGDLNGCFRPIVIKIAHNMSLKNILYLFLPVCMVSGVRCQVPVHLLTFLTPDT
jgi:hypothetical protein